MRTINVKHNQNLFDIAIQEYGAVTGVYWLLEDNPFLSGVTDNVYADQELLIRDELKKKITRDYLRSELIATGVEAVGIGYWLIENNFKVS